jgi:hypothetical protein
LNFMHVGKLALVLDTSKSDIFDGQGQAEKEDGEYIDMLMRDALLYGENDLPGLSIL